MIHIRRLLTITSVTTLAVALVIPLGPSRSDAAGRARAGGLTGTVLDHTGAPLNGVTVRAYALPGLQAGCDSLREDSVWGLVKSTTTRTGGAFSLPLATGSYRISATPTDLSTDSFGYWVDTSATPNVRGFIQSADDVFVPSGGRSGLTIQLAVPTTVSGTVRDPDTAAAIPNLQVRGVPAGDFGGQTAMIYPSTSTDAAGHYTLRGLPRTETTPWGIVIVDPQGWYPAFIWWHTLIGPEADVPPVYAGAGDTVRDVQFGFMHYGGRVSGHVVNERGRPLSGILVDLWTAFPYPPAITDTTGHFYLPVWSNPNVTLHFSDPAGKYRRAFYPGVPTAEGATLLSAAPGEEITITMRMLGDAAHVTGSAWYTIGQPAGGAVAGVAAEGASYAYVLCDGSFDVGGLWPGATTLEFTPAIPDGNPTATLHLTLAAGETAKMGTVEMPTWIIDGQVQDTNSDPVAAAQVDLMNAITWDTPTIRWWADEGAPSARAVTDDNGYFRVWLPDQPAGWPYLVVRDTTSTARFVAQIYDGHPVDLDPLTVVGDPVTDDDPWDAQASVSYSVIVTPVTP